MGRRFIALSIAIIGILLVASAGKIAAPRPVYGMSGVLPVGRSAPAAIHQSSSDRMLVSWVFRAEDLYSCGESARWMRHVQSLADPRVELRAVAVGSDTEVVESYLRRQRLRLTVMRIEERAYQQDFESAPTPALYVVSDGRIAASIAGSVWSDGVESRSRDLVATIDHLLRASTRRTSERTASVHINR